MTKQREPLSFEQLVAALNLTGVTFYEVGARLAESRPQANTEASGGDDGPELHTDWGSRVRHSQNEFGVRLRVEIEAARGEIVVDVAAEYEADEPFVLHRDVVNQYVNDVALMQLFPYIRETAMTLSSRVFGEALLMPVFMRGQVAFPVGDGPELSLG